MTMKNLRSYSDVINESELFEAFGKGPAGKAAVNPLFKNNFIDMATKAYGYKHTGDNLSRDIEGVKSTISVKDTGIKSDLIGDYPLTKTKSVDYVKFLNKVGDEARKQAKKMVKK
jgi:hypothetical protein